MLHQSPSQITPSAAPNPRLPDIPSVRADAYVAAMRAAGAVLRPVRGAPGAIDLGGTFTVEIPDNPDTRQCVAAVEAAHAPSYDAGHICFALIKNEARGRFASKVGDDLKVAMEELSRLHEAFRMAAAAEKVVQDSRPNDDPLQQRVPLGADIALGDYAAAQEHLLAMPIRSLDDIAPKLDFAERFCDEHERAEVLAAIEAFNMQHKTNFTPDRIEVLLAPRRPDMDVASILATCIAAASAVAKREPLEGALERISESTKRDLAATIGNDLAKALAALALMKKASSLDCYDYEMADDLDDGIVDRVDDLLVAVYLAGLDYVLALPVQSFEDIGRKVELGLRYCNTDGDRRKVLFDIANFVTPETVGALPDIPAIAA